MYVIKKTSNFHYSKSFGWSKEMSYENFGQKRARKNYNIGAYFYYVDRQGGGGQKNAYFTK